MRTRALRPMTVAVPSETYEPFRQQAERARQSVEEAVVQAMQASLTTEASTAAERRAMLAVLEALDTPALWQLIHRGAETEDVLILAALNEKRQRHGLTAAEEAAAQALIGQHDRAVLLRAKALTVLRQRGEDVAGLVAGP